MTTRDKLDDVMGYLQKYKWSFRDLIRHIVVDNSHYASKLIEAIWGDDEVIQKLQNEPSFKDATTGAEVYKHELTALESTTTFGRYTRTLEFNDIQVDEVHAELRRLAPNLLELMEKLLAASARRKKRPSASSRRVFIWPLHTYLLYHLLYTPSEHLRQYSKAPGALFSVHGN